MRSELNSRLVFAVVTIAVGSGFQYGYNIGVVNAPQDILEDFIYKTEINRVGNKSFSRSDARLLWSVAVSMYAVGGMFGGLSTSLLAERLGRKRGLIVTNIFSVIGGLIMESAKPLSSYEVIIIGRLIIGYSAGLHLGLAPLFLVEIAPIVWRGSIGSTFQLVVTICILLSLILGQPQILGTATLWPSLFALIVGPAVIQSFSLVFCPESPRFVLWKTNNPEKTQKVLKWLRQTDDVDNELDHIKAEIEAAAKIEKASLLVLIKDEIYRPLFFLSLVIMLSQQLSGINAIMYYSTHIFQRAGLSDQYALYATIAVGIVNVLVTVLSLWLVEKFGRRSLYVSCLFILIIVNVMLTVLLETQDVVKALALAFVLVVLIFLYIIVFATGLGGIPLFVVYELFDQNTRSLASSFAVFVNWLCNCLVGIAFLPLKDLMNGFVFLIFAGFLLIAFVYTSLKMPETKNKTPEEIRNAIKHGINLRTGASKYTEVGGDIPSANTT